MHVEDRLSFPTCPYSIILYIFLHDTTFHETRYGWITLSGDAELAGAKRSGAMYSYHLYTVGKPLQRQLLDSESQLLQMHPK
eukprot:4180073-Karenia_brevis.AAC.1